MLLSPYSAAQLCKRLESDMLLIASIVNHICLQRAYDPALDLQGKHDSICCFLMGMSSDGETKYKCAVALRAPPTSSTPAGTALQHVQRQQPQMQQQPRQQQQCSSNCSTSSSSSWLGLLGSSLQERLPQEAGMKEHLALGMLLDTM